MIIGLTGMTGAGKSTAAEILRRRGCHIIDADKVARRVTDMADILGKIVSAFGSGCINADGTLNRKVLGNMVFSDAEKLSRLNSITHPMITAEILSEAEAFKSGTVVIDAALLGETGLDKCCGLVLRITAPRELRASRIMERDGLTREEALARINSQSPYRGSHIDIDNSSSFREMEDKILEVLWQNGVQI